MRCTGLVGDNKDGHSEDKNQSTHQSTFTASFLCNLVALQTIIQSVRGKAFGEEIRAQSIYKWEVQWWC